MSIHGPINVPLEPSWPPSPSHANTTPSGKETLLPKTILEGSKSPTSSLETKKIEKHKPEPLDEKNENFKSRYFRVQQSSCNFEICKTKIAELIKKIEQKPDSLNTELNIRFRYVNNVLILSKFLAEPGKKTRIEYAREQVERMQKVAYFHASAQMAAYVFKVQEGINCLDMNIIRDDLLTLRRGIILGADLAEKELTEAVTFFETRWKELKEEGKISEEEYKILGQQLKQVLTEDPFRDEFIKHPELFKQVKNAPEALLKKYPHLASVNDFLARYPDAGTIRLRDGTYNLQNLKLTLSDAEASPLTQSINLLVEEPVITSTAAKLIKDFMLKHPKVQVYLGDEADGSELAKAFLEDKALVNGKGALMFAKGVVTGRSEPVYCYKIDPQDPFIRR